MTRVASVSGRGIQKIPVSQQAYFFIDMHGKNWRLADVEVDVKGFPNVSGGGTGAQGYDTDDSVFAREGGGDFLAAPPELL